MKTSEKVDLIIPALLKVKEKLQAVIKDSNNPFYKSKYATLESHLLEVEPLLAENGLLLLQPTVYNDLTNMNSVESNIYHSSGQFVSASLAITATGLDAQKIGASVTYYRRFTLGALLGIINADDDGNTASNKVNPAQKIVAPATGPNAGQGTVKLGTNPASVPQGNTAIAAKPSFRKPKPALTTTASVVARPTNTSATSTEDI